MITSTNFSSKNNTLNTILYCPHFNLESKSLCKSDLPLHEQTPFTNIPPELITMIISHLQHPFDLASIALTCKDFYFIAFSDENSWKIAYCKYFAYEEKLSGCYMQKTFLLFSISKIFHKSCPYDSQQQLDSMLEFKFAGWVLKNCKNKKKEIQEHISESLILHFNDIFFNLTTIEQEILNQTIIDIYENSMLKFSFLNQMLSNYISQNQQILAQFVYGKIIATTSYNLGMDF